MLRSTFSHRVRREPSTELFPIVRCAVCRWPAVDATQEPGARLGLKPIEVTGTVYAGPRADSPVSSFDKQTTVIRQTGECAACGAEMYLSGRWGSGLRVP